MKGDANDDDGPTFRSTFGPFEPPSHAVIRSVASLEGVDPLHLDSTLYGAVDPDALDGLLDHAARTGGGHVAVTVMMEGYEVRVCSDRTLSIRRARAKQPED